MTGAEKKARLAEVREILIDIREESRGDLRGMVQKALISVIEAQAEVEEQLKKDQG